MKIRHPFIIYLIIAAITFGDVATQPRAKRGEISGGEALSISACWPLWWPCRFFKWLKAPTSEEVTP
jgi:hypothetical protein